MINHNDQSSAVEMNVVGSSTFGVYPKISVEKTYNMYISDGWLIDYLGFKSLINLGEEGRVIFTSTIYNCLIVVVDNRVYQVTIIFNPNSNIPYQVTPLLVGNVLTFHSDIFIAENNAGQIAISDGSAIYIYNPTAALPFQTFNSVTLGFIPGYITFHDTYFIAAVSQDTFFSPPANNTWRLSESNDGTSWPADASHIGLLQTKPDNTQAALRFPSRGNMIFIMGTTVTENWFDVGYQLFPYQRNTGSNIDYGCISPATIASTDELVVWLAANEKSGPVIAYSDGGMVKTISSDGINNVLSELDNPQNSEAFIFKANGHIFYHINFYTDNITFFYDFETQKFFHACDENMNYFIARDVAFLNNQYYMVSRNDGNLYAFSTEYDTYDGREVPRIRVCKSIRRNSQDYFAVTDCGFTVEMGTTDPQYYDLGPAHLITEDGKLLITEGSPNLFITEAGAYLLTQDSQNLASEQIDVNDFSYLVTDNDFFSGPIYPRIDMSISTDGGYSFGSYVPYKMNPLGKRRNMLRWWQLGVANDWTAQFRFWGLGHFVAYDGVANIRN
jgi:hypothetical protein